MNTAERKYYTLEELARVSGLAQITIRRWWEAGKIPGYQPGGRKTRILFPVDALEVGATITAQLRPAATAAPAPSTSANANSEVSTRARRGTRARWRSRAAALAGKDLN